MNLISEVENIRNKLQSYLEQNDYKGWDPFDGLNSKLFQKTFLAKKRLFRLLWLQLFKRNPINLRKVVSIEKEVNPHTLGLLLSTLALKTSFNESDLNKIKLIVDKLESLTSKGWSGHCWGYNFDWQARAFFQPKYSPTIVPTTYIACGLLDIYQKTKEERLLKIARSCCDFVIKDLNRTTNNFGNQCFSYSPLDTTVVYNASLLASRLLSRVYEYTREPQLIELAKSSVDYCLQGQNSDGSWYYGEKPYHNWIDSFHTGYNLESIYEYMKISGDDCSHEIEIGLKYYLNNLFDKDQAKYYSNKKYPIDLNAVAQLIITLSKCEKIEKYKDLVDSVLKWTVKNMWDNKGYFYYQKNYLYTNKIPYMRWTQIWMYYSLTLYLKTRTGK